MSALFHLASLSYRYRAAFICPCARFQTNHSLYKGFYYKKKKVCNGSFFSERAVNRSESSLRNYADFASRDALARKRLLRAQQFLGPKTDQEYRNNVTKCVKSCSFAAPNVDWIWVSVVALAVLKRRNT